MTFPTPRAVIVAAHEPLTAALQHLDQPTPCAGSTRWIDDDVTIRAEAAEECSGCSIISQCAAAGALEQFGVWGGIDRTPVAAARLTARRRAAA